MAVLAHKIAQKVKYFKIDYYTVVMYPRFTVWERILNKPPPAYGSIEHVFYAFRRNEPPKIADMWYESESQSYRLDMAPRNCMYFTLDTMVGVGAKGLDNIKSVHIRFALLNVDENIPEPEVVAIRPTNISIPVGESHYTEEEKSETAFKAGGGASSEMLPMTVPGVSAEASAQMNKSRSLSRITKYKLDKRILIANASGVANRAIWEFYRDKEAREAIGQYNLEIIFRIPKPDKDTTKEDQNGKYYVDWNVEVNGRRLRDHESELNNRYWNKIVRGRKARDHVETTSTSEEKLKKGNREDPDNHKRLLRPLMLVTKLPTLNSIQDEIPTMLDQSY